MTYAIRRIAACSDSRARCSRNWNYDLYGQFAKVLYEGVYRNDFSKSRILKAMDVIIDPATGQPACRSAFYRVPMAALAPI